MADGTVVTVVFEETDAELAERFALVLAATSERLNGEQLIVVRCDRERIVGLLDEVAA